MSKVEKEIEEESVEEILFKSTFDVGDKQEKKVSGPREKEEKKASNAPVKGEKKPSAAQEKFEKCKNETDQALLNLEKCVLALKAAKAEGWQEHERRFGELQDRFDKGLNLGEKMPEKAVQELEQNVKRLAILGVQSTAKDAGAVRREQVESERNAKTLSAVASGKLLAQHQTAKNPDDYLKFIDAVDKEFDERDNEKKRWDKIDVAVREGAKTAEKFSKLFVASGSDKQVSSCQAVMKVFKEVLAAADRAEFKTAADNGAVALRNLDPLNTAFENRIKSAKSVQEVVAVGQAQVGALYRLGRKNGFRWLMARAIVVMDGFQDAVKTNSMDSAKRWLNSFVTLDDEWAEERKAHASWEEGKPKRQQNMALAKFLVAEGKTRKLDWLTTGAQVYLTNMQGPLDLAKLGQWVMAEREALDPGNKFKVIRDKFNAIQKPELKKEYDELVKDNPNGLEAEVKDALQGNDTLSLSDRLVSVENSRNSAKTQGLKVPDLSPGEAVAIFSYTTEEYKQINPMLLGIEKPDKEAKNKLDKLVKATIDALDKLPPLQRRHADEPRGNRLAGRRQTIHPGKHLQNQGLLEHRRRLQVSRRVPNHHLSQEEQSRGQRQKRPGIFPIRPRERSAIPARNKFQGHAAD